MCIHAWFNKISSINTAVSNEKLRVYSIVTSCVASSLIMTASFKDSKYGHLIQYIYATVI